MLSQIDNQRLAGNLIANILKNLKFSAGIQTIQIEKIIVKRAELLSVKKHWNLRWGPPILNFPGCICISSTNIPCHGIPSNQIVVLKDDLIKVDIVLSINDGWADSCFTYLIGKKYKEFYENAFKCFNTTISSINSNMNLFQVSETIDNLSQKFNLKIIKEYGGHFIGKRFHEEPFVSCIKSNAVKYNIPLNSTFTIEPIYSDGIYSIISEEYWFIIVNKPTIMFEHTILWKEKKIEIITRPQSHKL